MHPLIAARRSGRAFDPTPLDPADVEGLLEAARWAPSSMNEQPWRFLVVSIDDREAHDRLVAALTGSNPRWACRAPLLLIAGAKSTFTRNGSPNRHAMHDLGQAVAQLVLEAGHRGLVAHQMGGFDPASVRAGFGVPDDVELASVIAIGRPGDPDALPEDLRAREQAPRTRRPLAEIASSGSWGAPWRSTLGG